MSEPLSKGQITLIFLLIISALFILFIQRRGLVKINEYNPNDCSSIMSIEAEQICLLRQELKFERRKK